MTDTRNAARPWFIPADESQKRAAALFQRCDVLFLLGGAGSGKTHVAIALALTSVALKQCDRVVLLRPTVECGETLGYVPGDVDEKLSPWLGPVDDVLRNMTWVRRDALPIEATSLQHIRGRTVQNAVAVLDEAQNATREQLVAFLSRLGRGGKLILTGDATQCDLGASPLPGVATQLRGLSGVASVTLQGQHRHPLVAAMTKRLEETR